MGLGSFEFALALQGFLGLDTVWLCAYSGLECPGGGGLMLSFVVGVLPSKTLHDFVMCLNDPPNPKA